MNMTVSIELKADQQLAIMEDNPEWETLTQVAEDNHVNLTFISSEMIELSGRTMHVFHLIDLWNPVSLRIMDVDDL